MAIAAPSARYLEEGRGYGNSVMIADGKPVKICTVVVHRFTMGDVEDPILYAAQPLHDWETSEAGKWIMENSIETPWWESQLSVQDYNTTFIIGAKLTEANHIFFKLKFK